MAVSGKCSLSLELPRRPVLEALRHAHADYFFAIQYKLSRQEWMAKNQLVYTMQAARWRRVLGRADPVMTLTSPALPPRWPRSMCRSRNS